MVQPYLYVLRCMLLSCLVIKLFEKRLAGRKHHYFSTEYREMFSLLVEIIPLKFKDFVSVALMIRIAGFLEEGLCCFLLRGLRIEKLEISSRILSYMLLILECVSNWVMCKGPNQIYHYQDHVKSTSNLKAYAFPYSGDNNVYDALDR